jgi:hypothetical protein
MSRWWLTSVCPGDVADIAEKHRVHKNPRLFRLFLDKGCP